MLIVEIVGWMAAALILLAYILLSLGRLEANSVAYHALNISGAAGFIVNSGVNGAIPSAMLNVAWLGIGLYAMSRVLAKRRTES
jgi:hypothetical protein